jgi:ribosomal protein L7/L12
MSPTVRITGWRPGLEKVSMTHAIRRASGLDLAESKSCTDRVLEGETVEVKVRDAEAARILAAELQALGALAAVSDNPPE